MNSAERVVYRYLAAFTKYDPIYPKVQKTRKAVEKTLASYDHAYKLLDNEHHRRIPMFRPQQEAEHREKLTQYKARALTALKAVIDVASSVSGDVERWLDGSPRKRESATVWAECLKSLQGYIKDYEDALKDPTSVSYYGLPSKYTTKHLRDVWANFESNVEWAAKQSNLPDAPVAGASPEERFQAYFTPGLMTIVKAAAKKLKGHRAACAVLGGDVMEDVNAHSELRSIMGFLKPYYDEMLKPENEDLYQATQGLVSKIGSALSWDVIQAGAFCVAMLKLTGAPEAGSVSTTLVKEYAPLFRE